MNLVADKIRTALKTRGFEFPEHQEISLHLSGMYFVPLVGQMKLAVTPFVMPRPYSLEKTVKFRLNYGQYSGLIKCQVMTYGPNLDHGRIDECYAASHLSNGQVEIKDWPLDNYCSQQDRCGSYRYDNMLSFDGGKSDDLAVW